ncbi:hypothetical protein DFJ74DRAFT_441218 [Hyaloraphidium curvatum]|nr:hypothetical protein DFJ74DRAFT_441218 [Hyaloraphidium curvatum]
MAPVPDDDPSPKAASFESVPVVDLALLETDRPRFLADLRRALADVGFAYLKNAEGFDQASQERLFALAHAFYDQPQEKLLESEENRNFFGWQPPKKAELSQEFHYGYGHEGHQPDDESVPLWKRVLYGPNVWPKEVPGFQEAFEEHLRNCDALNRTLHRSLCESLGVPAGSLDKWCWNPEDDRPHGWVSVRIIHYTPLEQADEARRKLLTVARDGSPLALNEHRDYNPFLTLLIADDVGLEVMNHDGKWIPAPPIPGHVIVNVGCSLATATSDHLVATMHRVNANLSKRKRVSIPCFLGPDPAVPLEPIPGLKQKELSEEAKRAIEDARKGSRRSKLMETAQPQRKLLYNRRTNHPHTMLRYWPDLARELDVELGNVRVAD